MSDERLMRAAGPILATLAALGSAWGCEPVDPTVDATSISLIREAAGAGRAARAGNRVVVRHRIATADGREILKADEFRFEVGTGAVIEGIDRAVRGMRVGGERVFSCPPHLHWGRQGYADGRVPPNATLTVAIELRAID